MREMPDARLGVVAAARRRAAGLDVGRLAPVEAVRRRSLRRMAIRPGGTRRRLSQPHYAITQA
jgi:hypothetical protein